MKTYKFFFSGKGVFLLLKSNKKVMVEFSGTLVTEYNSPPDFSTVQQSIQTGLINFSGVTGVPDSLQEERPADVGLFHDTLVTGLQLYSTEDGQATSPGLWAVHALFPLEYY